VRAAIIRKVGGCVNKASIIRPFASYHSSQPADSTIERFGWRNFTGGDIGKGHQS
jgi:hypothetical protein